MNRNEIRSHYKRNRVVSVHSFNEKTSPETSFEYGKFILAVKKRIFPAAAVKLSLLSAVFCTHAPYPSSVFL